MRSQMLLNTRVRVLNFIRAYTRKNGYPPSLRDIGDGVGLSSLSSVTHQLDKLEIEGKITSNPNIPRSIVVREEVDVGKERS